MSHGRILAALGVAAVLAGSAFLAWPGLDIAASRGFYVPGAGFPMAKEPVALALRDLFRNVFDLAVIASILLLVNALILGAARAAIPARVWAFVLGAFALGPGLLVNTILKEHWGRARPETITEFGGTLGFTPPLVISDACARNCSFVSGEGAMAATLALVTAALILPNLAPWPRRWALMGIVVAATVAAILRVAMGRHFASDTIFAVIFCGVVVVLLHRLLGIGGVVASVTRANLVRDLRAGPGALSARLAALAVTTRRP